MPPPTDRLPRGGYLVAATIASASAASITIGRDDSHGAAIKDHLDVFVLPGGNAGQRDTAGVGDRREHVRGGLDVGVSVLHVDGQPWKARPRQEPGSGNASQRQPGSDLWFPGTQRSFDRILFQLSSSPQMHSNDYNHR